MKRLITIVIPFALALSVIMIVPAKADNKMYDVTITNLTRGQTFTPILVVSHRRGLPLFELGQAASDELVAVAESGNTAPLQDALTATGKVHDATSTGGLLAPGTSVTVQISAEDDARYISLVGMLIPTNDAFIAINGVRVPKDGKSVVAMSPTYDAGSEANDELCAHIPGPYCMGSGLSEAGGEGYVHIHAGIHGLNDLAAAEFDWRNPTAKISITRSN
jgi:hypothetical protein